MLYYHVFIMISIHNYAQSFFTSKSSKAKYSVKQMLAILKKPVKGSAGGLPLKRTQLA